MKVSWRPFGKITKTDSVPVASNDPVVENSLNHSLKDARSFAVMTGIGETYLSAFAIFLRATTPQIGLLASLPPLLGSLIQPVSAWFGRVSGHRKATRGRRCKYPGHGLATDRCIANRFSEPRVTVADRVGGALPVRCTAGSTAMVQPDGGHRPHRRRGRFFARRTKIVSLTTFTSLTLGGLLLQGFSNRGQTLLGFALLFGVALVARFVSVYHLTKMHDPRGQAAVGEPAVARRWWDRLRHSNFARFSVFFALTQFSVAIASPVLHGLHVA